MMRAGIRKKRGLVSVYLYVYLKGVKSCKSGAQRRLTFLSKMIHEASVLFLKYAMAKRKRRLFDARPCTAD